MEKNIIIPPKSPNDNRDYQAIVLDNGLKVILIHDAILEKSTCSISVGVGSLQDPDTSLGLAHFLEHMLFMGSKKYPLHNEYSSFISLNSGMDNAYTDDQQTNYYFQVSNKVFPEAMERLCGFFTGALLTPECISKQRQAVHEQYVLWTNDDNCRKWEIIAKLGQGPYSKFKIGNNETLGHDKIRDELVEFYNRHYSSNIINAVLSSSLPIQQMKSTLLKFLQQIPNKNHQPFKYQIAFPQSKTSKLVKMQSIKDQSIMQFFWVIEHLRHKYKDNVGNYLTHVLGHEGKHSLLNILKGKKYASSITSYQRDLMNQTLIGLQIKLTQDGEEQYQLVYNIVIDYVSSLKATQYIFDQIRQKAQIEFKFMEKIQNHNYVCSLSSHMHHIPLEQVLNYKSLINDYDENKINSILAQLNPFNLIVVFSSNQELQNSQTEQYLGAKYRVENLPSRKNSKEKFYPLVPNPFLPLSTEVIAQPSVYNYPRKLRNYVYFQQDNQFKACRGGINLTAFGDQTYTFLNFYNEYLELLLKPVAYDAQALGIQIDYQGEQSLEISIFGFNDTVKKLIKKIGEELIGVHQSQDSQILFEIAKADYIEDLQNFYSGEADQIANSTKDLLFIQKRPSIDQLKSQVQKYKYKQVVQRACKFWKRATLQWVIVGNFLQSQAIQIIDFFQSKIPKEQKSTIHSTNCLKLSQKQIKHEILLTQEEISTSCSVIYFQAGKYSQKLYYILKLLQNHISEPFFNQLRTLKQLAYYLAARVEDVDGTLGLKFLLVSSTKDPQFISNQIHKFVSNFFSKMPQELTQEKIKQLKDSVRTLFIAPHNNLKRKFNSICSQVADRTHYFDRKNPQKIDIQLSAISKQDLIDCANLLLERSFEILVVSVAHQSQYNTIKPLTMPFKQIKQKSQFYDGLFGKLDFSFKNQ